MNEKKSRDLWMDLWYVMDARKPACGTDYLLRTEASNSETIVNMYCKYRTIRVARLDARRWQRKERSLSRLDDSEDS